MNLLLFPKNEEWGTGDEALDIRLSQALRSTTDDLSLQSISEFYLFGMSLRPRIFNPALPLTIEAVTKSLLFYWNSEEYNDSLFKKLRGRYFLKEKVTFDLKETKTIVNELRNNQKYRYKNEIDFYLIPQKETERNPFILFEIKRSPYDLQAKIIFKEFKNFLNGESVKENYNDAFFLTLKSAESILVIEDFAEIWYDDGKLFSLSKMTAKSADEEKKKLQF